jgi:hypothetical protein
MKRRGAPLLAAALALILGGGTACRENSRPDPEVHMAISHEPEDPGAAGNSQAGGATANGGAAAKAPTRLEVPPEVEKAWSGIRLRWKDLGSGKEGTLDVPLGDAKPLPDPDIVVRGDVFLPAFTMSGDAITSQGTEPQNPAARITVFEKGKEIFGGWIFTRFPDVHPFTHPKYQLRLEGGVPRAKS